MDYQLRRLDENDLALMRSLNSLFGEVFADPESYHNHPPHDDYVKDFLRDKAHIVVVATNDDTVIGGLVAYYLKKFEQNRGEVYLYDLAVSYAHQHQGVGTALVQKLKIIARDMGAYIVFVQADQGDDAVHFYKSLQPIEDIKTINFDFDVKE